MALENTMKARDHFRRNVEESIRQPLAVYRILPRIVNKVLPPSMQKQKEALADGSIWRPFSAPLFVYLMCTLEAFLEEAFIGAMSKKDTTSYSDWSSFWENRKPELKQVGVAERFSFHNLGRVGKLYHHYLGVDLESHSQFGLIDLMVQKRHLFVHRVGHLNDKFIERYNAYHTADPSRQIPTTKEGCRAFIEMDWVEDSVKEVEGFVDWIWNQLIDKDLV